MILVLGSNGKLGRTLMRDNPEFIGWNKEDLDVTERGAVIEKIGKLRPEAVINCTGFTNVDECEKNPRQCWWVNVYGVKNLVEACEKAGSFLVHISSNYAINPVNEYGWTKKSSEALAGGGLVIRTDFYTTETYLVRKILMEKGKVNAYSDQEYNPISVYSLSAEITANLARRRKGIINIGTRKKISPYEFAVKLCRVFKKDESRVAPTPFVDGSVRRPKHLYLVPDNKIKIEDDLELFRNELEKQENSDNIPAS